MWIAVIVPVFDSSDDAATPQLRQIVLSGETVRNEVFLGKQQ
jgi:hypothetical protein